MPTLDPATQYATDVIAGREVAGRLVRLACARHLDDVKQQVAKGLEWKPDEASPVYEFFETILCLPEETDAKDDASPEASPFILTPFQKFIVGSLFGWYVAGSGKRRFSKAYIETGKGSGKSPLAAGIALYMLIADGTRGAQIFTAAVTLDQAKIPFADAEKMVKASAWLSEHVDQKRNNLAVLSSGNFMRPISAEKRGLDGKRVKCAIVEELHEHQTPIVAQKIIAGIKGQPNPLIFMPTNAGYDRESICWHYHEYSREVLEGTTTDETWFAYVCHMDPCEPCYAAGKRQPTDGCPDCDDWKTEGPHWLKANPNLGVSLPWNYLREQVRVAVGMPSSRNIVKRLNFCEWTDQVTVWIPPEQWAACKGAATAASLVGRECYIGIDLSDHIDLTSIVLVFTTPGEPALKVDLGTSPVGDQQVARSVELNVSFDLLSFFWLPEAILRKRAAEDKIDYPLWKELGHLKTTDGSNINLDDLYDFVVNDLAV
jgi:phage terminase large subunit-like protein